MPEQTDIYISSFPDAESITDSDKVTGLQGNANKNFTFSSILSWIALKLSNAFVSASRTINGKSLSSDVTLTATDVGARPNTWTPSAADVGAIPTTAKGAPLGVAELDSNGQVPSSQLDLSGKQDEITASGILKGDGAGGVSAATAGTDYQVPLTFDNTPTANSANPVKSGGVYADVRTRVPNYGMGVNLLRNWYFVGGGTGRGIFPVNQRGQTTYTANGYRIDGWTSGTHSGTVTLNATGISIYSSPGGQTIIRQLLDLNDELDGKTCTMSVLTASGVFTGTGVLTISATSTNRIGFSVGTTGYVNVTTKTGTPILVDLRAVSGSSIEYIAAKLELGTEQTLAHQENGTWVLNEVPDYEYELYRCMTSTADPSDTYANKSLATRQDLTNIQATGTTNTTGAAIPAGAYFYLNGVLHRAKEQIDANATFTVNTNCEQVPEGGLNALPSVTVNTLTIEATSYVTNINQCHAYTVGRIAYVFISCQIAATPVALINLIKGIPLPYNTGLMFPALTSSGVTAILAVTVENGEAHIRKGSNNATTAGWYSGAITYPIA